MKRQIELLAPAGSKEALIAAVQNGADAVYLGAGKYNARRMADNFTDMDLKEVVEYAHLYGVKIYITLNILIKERELRDIRGCLDYLKDLCVDGLIVQDLGLAKIVAKDYPELSLHASTQMTIHQLEGAKVIEDLGFSRVVLARELSLEEIRQISEKTSLELETFVHGALCVSYSGQCLMSSMVGGRSGNRGMCAQPCRMLYRLESKQQREQKPLYHLSTRDLSTIDILDEIIGAGVSSLKIEGRMKRPEYVAVVIKEYRRALDDYMKLGKTKISDQSREDLLQIFNRGFTKGYYYGTDHRTLYSNDKPNNRGIFIGTVHSSDNRLAYIDLEKDLSLGDGLEFRRVGESEGKGQTLSEMFVEGLASEKAFRGQRVGIRTNFKLSRGIRVYRTSRLGQLKDAASTYESLYASRKIPILARVTLKKGLRPEVEFKDNIGLSAKASADLLVAEARTRPTVKEDIIGQLERLGDTPFEIVKWDINLDDNLFIPLSTLNQLRRHAANDLANARIRHFNEKASIKDLRAEKTRSLNRENSLATSGPGSAKQVGANASIKRPRLHGYLDRLALDPDTIKGLDMVFYNPSDFDFRIDDLLGQIRAIKDMGIGVGLCLPTITRSADLRHLRGLADEFWQAFDAVQAGNIGQISLLAEKGIKETYAGYSFNIMNSASVKSLADLAIGGLVLSPELTLAELDDIIKNSILSCEITVYGRIVLMTTEYCPHVDFKKGCTACNTRGNDALIDRMGYSFPLRKKRIGRCYTELLNSLPIFVADDISPIKRLNAGAWGLRLEGLAEDEIKDIIKLYAHLGHSQGQGPRKWLPEAEETIDRIKASGFTRGHFYRGVD